MNVSKINANQTIGFAAKAKSQPRRAHQESKFDAFISSPKTKKAVKFIGLTALVVAAAISGKAILKKLSFNKAVKTEAARRIAESKMTQTEKINRALPNAVQAALDTPLRKGEKIGNTPAGIRLDGLTHALEVDKRIAHLEEVDKMHRARHMGLIQAFKSEEVLPRANFDKETAQKAFDIEIKQLGEKIEKAAQKAQPKA